MSKITPNYFNIKQLLQSQSFAIDEYQREYKWEKEHIDELLSDLQGKFFSSYKAGDKTSAVSQYEKYFLGSIIVSERNGKKFLIDGQQRITSFTLLFIYLYRKASEQYPPLAQTIAPLIFSDNLGEPTFNLDIPERLPVIEALFKQQPYNPDGKDESIQTMFARFGDIEQNDLFADIGEALPHFVYWLMTRVGLIEIATDNDNDAYAIFETMNDRGKPLSPVDMLKAYLLAPIEQPEKRLMANQVWKKQVLDLISWGGVHEPERDANAIKAWLRAQFAESTRERKAGATDRDWELVGTVFHRWVRDNSERLEIGSEGQNFKIITENFPFFAQAYLHIQAASRHYTPGLEAIFYNAHNDFTWQNTVLLAPLQSSDDSDTLRRKLALTATYLDIWLMRRVVNYVRVGYSSIYYAMFLLCREIRRKSLPELYRILSQKLTDDEASFEGIPSKNRRGISELVLNQFSRRYIFHLLARVTAFVEKGSGRTDAFDKYVDRSLKNPFDIEHIWANDFMSYREAFQSEQEFHDWRDHVASLVLLPADVNRSLQDKPYALKVGHYAKQNVYAASLTSEIYQHQPQFAALRSQYDLPFKAYAQFGKTEQQERRLLLARLVNQIWSPARLAEIMA